MKNYVAPEVEVIAIDAISVLDTSNISNGDVEVDAGGVFF